MTNSPINPDSSRINQPDIKEEPVVSPSSTDRNIQSASQPALSASSESISSRRSSLAGRVKIGAPEATNQQETTYEARLKAWFDNPSITGDKQTAVEKIKEALTNQEPELSLEGLELSEAPPLDRLDFLKIVDLSHNKLSEFPSSILSLSGLTALNLSDNNISSLPTQINQLSQLTGLAISENRLTHLPETFTSLNKLTFLDLSHNSLQELPLTLDNFASLERLDLSSNQDLREIPFSLGNVSTLSSLDYEDTQINPEAAEAILDRSEKARSGLSGSIELEERLPLWYAAAKKMHTPLALDKFEKMQRGVINEWLKRLEETPDFQGNQAKMAEVAYNLLDTAIKDEEYRTEFLSQLEMNNADCENRAAASLNSLYLGWSLNNLSPETDLQQKLAMLASGAKTLALHQAIDRRLSEWEKEHQAPPIGESVEVRLYFETQLRNKLGLLTLNEEMGHPEFAEALLKNLDIPLEEFRTHLEATVKSTYVDHLVSISSFQKLAMSDPEFKASLDQATEAFQEQLVDVTMSDKSEFEMKKEMDELMAKREADTKQRMIDWFLKNFLDKN